MKTLRWTWPAAAVLAASLGCTHAWAANAAASPAAAKAKEADKLKSERAFKDCKECPEMVAIPAGRFVMGTPETDDNRVWHEGPDHSVSVKSFALGKTHVTRGEYAAFVAATGRQPGTHCWALTDGWNEYYGRNWRNSGYPQEDSHPVICISWDDANAYAAWLSEKTGKRYRLPTEAEWEYAARANTATERFWGDEPGDACPYANVADKSTHIRAINRNMWGTYECNDGWAFTAPVGSFKPNAFGLYDMIGNAWTWVQDCWNEGYKGAPTDGSAWMSGKCDQRVLRGAAWIDAPAAGRSATRFRRLSSDRFFTIGFRVARDMP